MIQGKIHVRTASWLRSFFRVEISTEGSRPTGDMFTVFSISFSFGQNMRHACS